MEKSIFSNYFDAQYLQVMIDSRLEKFNAPWWKSYFKMAIPQLSLTYSSVLASSTITPAASFATRDGETPLRSREAMEKMTGEIPPIKVMRPLDEEQSRNYKILQNLSTIGDADKKNQALKLIWDDVKFVSEAVDKRLDYTVAEAISTGKITITADNNPDGIVVGTIDLKLPAGNKKNAAVAWSTPATATPITDITNVVNAGQAEGRYFSKMLIDRATLLKFIATKEVKDTVGTFFGLSAAAKASQTAPLTIDRINEYMNAAKLPVFEVTDIRIPIEKDGTPTILSPFEANNIVFIPEGDLGEIKNAIAMEDMDPVENVTYLKKENTLISKWKNNEPFREWTKAELNAFPVVSAIKGIYLLSTNKAF